MSNFLDNLSHMLSGEQRANMAPGTANGQPGAGRSVIMDALGKNNMGGMLGAGALGGLLGALLGKGGKDLAGTALALGGTAAVGTLAWSFYKKWSQNNGQGTPGAAQTAYAAPSRAVERAVMESPDAAEPVGGHIDDVPTAKLLLQAMVFAARADGHIDDEERGRINATVREMFPDRNLSALMEDLMQEPIDPRALAAQVHSQEQAQDLYRLSCAIVEPDQFMERSYLDGLAEALNIPAAVKEKMEKEAELTRHQAQG